MNRQAIVAIALGVVALLVVGKQLAPMLFGGGGAPPPPPAPSRPMPTLPMLSDETEEELGTPYTRLIAIVSETGLDFQQPGLRNPFRPLAGPGSLVAEQELLDTVREMAGGLVENPTALSADELNLGYRIQGIVWNEGEPMALVNGQVLAVGEEIEEGGIITAITDDSVVFLYEGQLLTIFVDTED